MSEQELRSLAQKHGQGHIFQWWDELDKDKRARLLEQVRTVDFDLVDEFRRTIVQERKPLGTLLPSVPTPLPGPIERVEAVGWEALARGEVAAVVVAGGQGTRLGYDRPKGMYPLSPIRRASLFQIFAESVLARARFGAVPHWIIVVSDATDAQTQEFFAENRFFGLPRERVHFIKQGNNPSVDLQGRLILKSKYELAFNPDGHGGCAKAIGKQLDLIRSLGVKYLYWFQVDNPIARILDPAFVGAHILHGAEFSAKALRKRDAAEKLGMFIHEDGRLKVIEYTELPRERQEETLPDGSLRFGLGNISIFVIGVELLERVCRPRFLLPVHASPKPIPYIGARGELVQPGRDPQTGKEKVTGYKFEYFTFDSIMYASKVLLMETSREAEFAPVKNRNEDGQDTPNTARAAMMALHRQWLREAGFAVSDDAVVEISPLYAMSAAELAARLAPGTKLSFPLLLAPER